MALDPKLQKFTTASPVLANYSYTDVAEGTGMQKLYLFQQKETTNTTIDVLLPENKSVINVAK